MSSGHTHLGGPNLTQNQGNVLGDRPCVRQSRLYREHVGGNAMKDIMGQDALKWDTNRTQGAYDGGRVYDNKTMQMGAQEQQQQYPCANEQQRQQVQQVTSWQQPPPAQFQQQQQQQPQQQSSAQPQQQSSAQPNHRRGAAVANRSTYNILTGE